MTSRVPRVVLEVLTIITAMINTTSFTLRDDLLKSEKPIDIAYDAAKISFCAALMLLALGSLAFMNARRDLSVITAHRHRAVIEGLIIPVFLVNIADNVFKACSKLDAGKDIGIEITNIALSALVLLLRPTSFFVPGLKNACAFRCIQDRAAPAPAAPASAA